MNVRHEAIRRARDEVQGALESGEHILRSLAMTDVEIEGVDLAVQMAVTPQLANAGGSLLGGLTATLIDLVAGRLAMGGLEGGRRTATNDMTIHFLAPIVGGPARAEAHVLRRGRRSVVVQVDVRDLSTDRLAAVATMSFAVLDPLPNDDQK
jgi:uncharacterized protein (TIGR00369 family)